MTSTSPDTVGPQGPVGVRGPDGPVHPSMMQAPEPLAEQVAEIMPEPQLQLAALVDAYAEAKDAVDAAQDRLKDLRDQLLLEANGAAQPNGHLYGARSVVKFSTVSTWRVDTTRLKSEQPALYAAYARQSSSTKVTVGPR